jgi:hypothetical protein
METDDAPFPPPGGTDALSRTTRMGVVPTAALDAAVLQPGDDAPEVLEAERKRRDRRNRRKRKCKYQFGLNFAFINMNNRGNTIEKWGKVIYEGEQLDLDIIAVAETFMREEEMPPPFPGWKYVGANRQDDQPIGGGVGLFYKEDMKVQVIEKFQGESLKLQLELKGDVIKSVNIAVAYLAPSREFSEYQDYIKNLKCDILNDGEKQWILLGDWNAHMEEFGDRQDDRGEALKIFLAETEMALLNADRKCEGSKTWTRGDQCTTIDYIAVSPRLLKYMNRIIIDEGSEHDIGTDHNWFIVKSRGRTATRSRGKRKEQRSTLNVEKFQEEIQRELLEDSNYLQMVNKIREIKLNCTEQKDVFENERPYWNEELDHLYRIRKGATRKYNSALKEGKGEEEVKQLEAKRNEARAKFGEKLNECAKLYLMEGPLKKIKEADPKQRPRLYFEYVREALEGKHGITTHPLIDHRSGEEPGNPKEYLTELAKEMFSGVRLEETEGRRREGIDITVSMEKIKRRLQKIGENTAKGLDEITVKMLKDEKLLVTVAKIIQNILDGGEVSADLVRGRVSLIEKDSSQKGMLNTYRPITIMSIVYRLLSFFVNEYIMGWAEENNLLEEYQNGFRLGRRLEDNILVITELIEMARKQNDNLYVAFLDTAKAYDSVNREILYARLRKMGMPEPVVQLIEDMYSNASVVIRYGKEESEAIHPVLGLRQGCSLSSILYLLYVFGKQKELEKAGGGYGITYRTSGITSMAAGHSQYVNSVNAAYQAVSFPALLFADDEIIISYSKEGLQKLLEVCGRFATESELKYNPKKCLVINFGKESDQVEEFRLQDGTIHSGNEYKYLGVWLSDTKNYLEVHEKKLISKAIKYRNTMCGRIRWTFDNSGILRTLWKMVAVPSLTHCNAVLSISAATRKRLDVIQRSVGRKALGCSMGVATEFIEGEFGCSSFEMRETCAKKVFKTRIESLEEDRWVRKLITAKDYIKQFEEVSMGDSKFDKRMRKLEQNFEIGNVVKTVEMRNTAFKREIKRLVDTAATKLWDNDRRKKSSLRMYNLYKEGIQFEHWLHSNSRGSGLLMDARAGVLKTRKFRTKYEEVNPKCNICEKEEEEDVEHILFNCNFHELQQYKECRDRVEMALGFKGENTKECVQKAKRILISWYYCPER